MGKAGWPFLNEMKSWLRGQSGISESAEKKRKRAAFSSVRGAWGYSKGLLCSSFPAIYPHSGYRGPEMMETLEFI